MKKLARALCIVLAMVLCLSVAGCDPVQTNIRITFETNGGTAVEAISVEANAQLSLPASTRDGFEFNGWFTDQGLTKPVGASLNADTVLYAAWVAEGKTGDAVRITFNTNGGTAIQALSFVVGDNVTLSNAVREGFVFEGWYIDANCTVKAGTTFTVTRTLYAKWRSSGASAGSNNETTPLVLSVQELDKVFNPYFATSGYDTEITGNTQISMLTSDAKGNVYCGAYEPTVALNYNQTIWYNGEPYDPTNPPDLGNRNPSDIDEDDYYTEYEFLIKNNIMFSDGTPLTIKDVIYNMYLYLDPSYTGSSTMYSTPIKGMNEYRTQQEQADDDADSAFNSLMLGRANQRLSTIRALYHPDDNTRKQMREGTEERYRNQALADLEEIRYMFWSELKTDWNNAVASLESYEEEYGYTEAWEVFLTMEGLITVEFNADGTIKVDDVTKEKKIEYGETKSWYHDSESMINIVFNEYLGVLEGNAMGNYVDSDAARAAARAGGYPERPVTDLLFDEGGATAIGSTLGGGLHDAIYNSSACGLNVYSIVTYWATAGNAREMLIAEEKSAYFAGRDKVVDSISGITVATASDEFNGIFGKTDLSETHHVLKIVIDRVDPKAIWNFGFTVAPMHYYSNADEYSSSTYSDGFSAADDYRSFNYPGCPGYDTNKPISTGMPYASKLYFDKVIKANIGLPVGAGLYKASTQTGAEPTSGTQFCSDNIVYFERNPYFWTTSGYADQASSPIQNCKIRFLRYKVIASTKLLDSIIQSEIHYGDPSANKENLSIINSNSAILGQSNPPNNGYGYIGLNARYIPDLAVRKAIMHAMDTSLILSYYPGGQASLIYRPMSKESWAYPEGLSAPYWEYDSTGRTSEALVTGAGYAKNASTGIYERKLSNGETHKLEYTFTIAGSTDDHPAFATMTKAAEILNQHGFKVTVKTDAQALSKLASGSLTVWAAAWSSTIDPDMYQVYHMNSAATSVRNWGYPDIIERGREYPELVMIEELSDLIEEARSILDQNERKRIYKEALDSVMELCVELPTYQRNNLYVYRKDVIDTNTLNKNITAYSGPLSRMWEVELVG